MTNKLLRKPQTAPQVNTEARFGRYSLLENPFPSDPFVNKDSADKRINGDIYEMALRELEYGKIRRNFLTVTLSTPNHLRLGYIIEDSYVGRGNGKTAFLVNLQHQINREYCLDISDGANKCFAIYVEPEAGGRTKSFNSFIDLVFRSMQQVGLLEDSVASLVFDAIGKLYPDYDLEGAFAEDAELSKKIFADSWYTDNSLRLDAILTEIVKNEALQSLPQSFPLVDQACLLLRRLPRDADFEQYFQNLKKGSDRHDFIFSHLVSLFVAAGFNGGFILVDDFEKIPDFQSARQKKDFALELRSCLYDGYYLNARLGFYNLLLVLHAGVQNLISDAWAASGLENRAPITPKVESDHVVVFEKLSPDHASLLIQKYLAEYRTTRVKDPLSPFTIEAVRLIAEMSELNASRILKTCFYLLEDAADEDAKEIDDNFVRKHEEIQNRGSDKKSLGIEDIETEDLLGKALAD